MSDAQEPADQARRPSMGGSIMAAAGLIAAVTLLSRFAGFARTLVFSGNVGATEVGEVYQSVNTLPNVVFEVAAGGVLAAVVVPLVASRIGTGDREGADRVSSALLTWAVTILLPLAVLLALAAPALTRVLLSEPAGSEAAELGRHLLLVFAPQVPLYGIGIVLSGVLQAHRRFLAATLAPLLSSLVVMGAYLLYPRLADGADTAADVPEQAVAALAWGTTLGVVVLSLPLFVPAFRAGIRLRPTWQFPGDSARRAGVLAGAGLTALVAQQAAVLVTVYLANQARGTGTLNVYAYLQAVYLLPYAVLAVPIATSTFPALAQSQGSGQHRPDTLNWSLRAILLVGGLAAAVLIAVSRPVGVFFAGLDAASGTGTGGAALAALPIGLVAYAPGLVGFAAAALLTRALYVRGRASLAGAAMAAGWAVAALGPWAVLGRDAEPAATLRALGVFSSLGMSVAAVLLTVLVHRSWGGEAVAGLRRTVPGLVVAMTAGFAAGDVAAVLLDPTSVAGAVVAGLIAAVSATAVYVAVMALVDAPTVNAVRERGRRRREG